GDVAVAEDPEAATEETLLDAVSLDVLSGEEADERLCRRQPDRLHGSTSTLTARAARSSSIASGRPESGTRCVTSGVRSTRACSWSDTATGNTSSGRPT